MPLVNRITVKVSKYCVFSFLYENLSVYVLCVCGTYYCSLVFEVNVFGANFLLLSVWFRCDRNSRDVKIVKVSFFVSLV